MTPTHVPAASRGRQAAFAVARSLFEEDQERLARRTDRMFAGLMTAQWIAGLLLTAFLAPRVWAGAISRPSLHLWAAATLGTFIPALPVALALLRPGRPSTRYVIAVGQMLQSALLIHLTGGRIESHFHVFGSLAFLAFYRDWRVLIPATVVVAADHILRGAFFPQSVYGVTASSNWRWVEHAGWVIFEDVFLALACVQSRRDMWLVRCAEERFRGIFENAVMGIFQTTPDGRYLSANPALARIYGYDSPDELTARVTDVRHQLYADPTRRPEFVRLMAHDGRVTDFDSQVRRKDGSLRWISECARAVADAATGELLYYEGTVEDVTDRKLAQEQARHAAKLALVASRTDNAVVITDVDGRVEWVNEGFTRITEYTLADVAGRKPGPVLQGRETDPATIALIRERLARREGVVTEIVNYSKSGRRYWITIEIQPHFAPDGQLQNFIAIERDITDWKQAQAALQQAKEAAEQAKAAAEAASRAKSDFLANMSHEIRTPLNGVIGMTDLLLRHGLTDQQLRYARVVKSSAETLLALINDILDFSKIEAGKLEIESTEFHLGELIEDTAHMLAQRAAAKGLEFACHAPPGPLGRVPDAVRGDPVRLRQILTNLLNNAIKFTERGEVVVRVTLDALTDRAVTVRFAVRDTGVGIPPDRMDRLFKSFSQVDASTTRKYGGTGLGLAISKQLAELMGGAIGVDSEPGRGSTFWFTAQLQLCHPRAESAPAPPLAAALRDARVLVADDHATYRDLLREQLSAWQMSVDVAEDGRRAVEMARVAAAAGRPYRVAVLDLNMPRMGGLDAAAAIRADALLSATRLVMLTPIDNAMHGDALRAAGFDGLITKPMRQSQAFDALAAVLAGPALSQASDGGRPVTSTAAAPAQRHRAGRVLLVEDNEVNQMVATEVLRDAGFACDVAGDGHRALEMIAVGAYAVALMDCQMPGIDGFETTRRLREAERAAAKPRLPVIALTANAIQGDRERCLAAGMDGYVTKPINADDLIAAIERLVPDPNPPSAVAPSAHPPKDATASAIAAIDVPSLLRRCNGKAALVEKLLGKFAGQADQYVQQLRESLERRDGELFHRAAHTLKGSAANLSAERVRRVAAELERIGDARELTAATETVESLMAQLSQVLGECVAHIPAAVREATEVARAAPAARTPN